MMRNFLGLAVLLVAIASTGCPNPVSNGPAAPISSTIQFSEGDAVIKAIGSPVFTNAISGDGTGTLSYTSSDTATATVDSSSGQVTVKALGTTTITASKAATATHTAVSKSYSLKVLLASVITLADGDTLTKILGALPFTNTVSGAGDGTLSYSSGNLGVATIDTSTGTVNPIAKGTTVITITKASASTCLCRLCT